MSESASEAPFVVNRKVIVVGKDRKEKPKVRVEKVVAVEHPSAYDPEWTKRKRPDGRMH